MSRHARNVDANQVAIVEAFRRCGASVLHLHTVGGGCPDLLVGVAGVDVQVEVKDGRKKPSAQALSEAQEEHRRSWRGRPVVVVRSAEQAWRLVERLRRDGV